MITFEEEKDMMTFEEAKDVFLNHGWIKVEGGTYFDGSKWREAVRVLGDYLQREPCEDTISRQAVKKALEDRFMELQKRHSADRYETNFCLNTILELPSVTPQSKMGHWIDSSNGWMCSECKRDNKKDTKYCPNCGAKMQEVEE